MPFNISVNPNLEIAPLYPAGISVVCGFHVPDPLEEPCTMTNDTSGSFQVSSGKRVPASPDRVNVGTVSRSRDHRVTGANEVLFFS